MEVDHKKMGGLHRSNPCSGENKPTGYDHLLRVSGTGKIRRPPNAFMLFARDHRKKVSMDHPHETNKTISTILGRAWRATPPDRKVKYYSLAKKLDAMHKSLYPKYSYNPKVARLQKKNRQRMKSERSTIATTSSDHQHVSPSECGQFHTRISDTVQVKTFKQEMNTTANALDYSEGGPHSEPRDASIDSSDTYQPPDVASSRYPLIGAMDDPPNYLLADNVERMRNMAEAMGSSTYPQTDSGQSEGDGRTDEKDIKCEHQHLPHVPMPHWVAPHYPYQYYYGRRFDPRLSGHRDGYYPASDPSTSYRIPHGYGSAASCPCGHCPQDTCFHMMKGYPGMYPPYLPHKHVPYYPMVNDPRLHQGYYGHVAPSEHYYVRPPLDMISRNKPDSCPQAIGHYQQGDLNSPTGRQLVPYRYHDHTYHQHPSGCLPYHGDTTEIPVEPIVVRPEECTSTDTNQSICVEDEKTGDSENPNEEHPDDFEENTTAVKEESPSSDTVVEKVEI